MRRLTATLLVVLVVVATPAVATAQDDGIADDCFTIVGCADAGPEPENPGDRGGWAQLMTLGVLVGAVAFIMTKVIRGARATQSTRQPTPPGA